MPLKATRLAPDAGHAVASTAARAGLRHNRRMQRLASLMLVLGAAVGLSAGCGRGGGDDAARRGASDRLERLAASGSVVEWRGRLPCADCRGIDTRLMLGHDDGGRVYELVEVYVSGDGETRFEEAGRWRVDNALLELESEEGGLRRYAVVHGGMLQVRDLRGRVFPGRERDLLLPTGHPSPH